MGFYSINYVAIYLSCGGTESVSTTINIQGEIDTRRKKVPQIFKVFFVLVGFVSPSIQSASNPVLQPGTATAYLVELLTNT